MLQDHLTNKQSFSADLAKQVIDGDRDRGIVFYRPQGGDITRLFECKRFETTLKVHDKAKDSGLDFDFQGNLKAINEAA